MPEAQIKRCNLAPPLVSAPNPPKKGAIVKMNGTAIFSYKMDFLINFHIVGLNAAEVNSVVL